MRKGVLSSPSPVMVGKNFKNAGRIPLPTLGTGGFDIFVMPQVSLYASLKSLCCCSLSLRELPDFDFFYLFKRKPRHFSNVA